MWEDLYTSFIFYIIFSGLSQCGSVEQKKKNAKEFTLRGVPYLLLLTWLIFGYKQNVVEDVRAFYLFIFSNILCSISVLAFHLVQYTFVIACWQHGRVLQVLWHEVCNEYLLYHSLLYLSLSLWNKRTCPKDIFANFTIISEKILY